MSELTRCNFCSLNDTKRRYGTKNVRTTQTNASDEMAGWIKLEVRENGIWRDAGYMMSISDHCVC